VAGSQNPAISLSIHFAIQTFGLLSKDIKFLAQDIPDDSAKG